MPRDPDAPVRASGMQQYLRCGVAYRRSELEHEGRPPTTALIRGSAVHRGVGVGLMQQMRTGSPAPVDMMEDVAASEIDRARRGGATLTEAEHSAGLARTFGGLKDEAVRYAGTYARLIAPWITPVAVERKVTVALPGFKISGTIDTVTQDADGEIIRDTKTSGGRAPQKDAADRSVQLTMYDVLRAAEKGDGQTTQRVALDYLVRNKSTGDVTPVHLASTRGPRDRIALINRVRTALDGITAGIFLPADPQQDFWCSEKFCEFWSSCPYAFGPARGDKKNA